MLHAFTYFSVPFFPLTFKIRIMILPLLVVVLFLTTLFQVPLQFCCLEQEIQLQKKNKKKNSARVIWLNLGSHFSKILPF